MNDVVSELQDLTALAWDERATTSGTAGTYLKSRTGNGARRIYFKLSRFNGTRIDGHECVNEVIASRLMSILGIAHLEYRLIHANVRIYGQVHETWLNSSKNFRQKGDRKQAFDMYFGLYRNPDEAPLAFCQRMGWTEGIKRMMVVDYLLANRDRHGANIEVLVDAHGTARLAPLFDNGLSLVAPYADDEERIAAFDPLRDVRTTNFIGSSSLEENLRFAIDAKGIGELEEEDKTVLLNGLSGATTRSHLEKAWEIIWERWKHYAALRDNR